MTDLVKVKENAVAGIDPTLLAQYAQDTIREVRAEDYIVPNVQLAQNNCTAQAEGLCGDGDFYSFDTGKNYGKEFPCLIISTVTQLSKRFYPNDSTIASKGMGLLMYLTDWKQKYGVMEDIVLEGVQGVSKISESILIYFVMPDDLKAIHKMTLNIGSMSTGRRIRTRQIELIGLGIPPFLEKIKIKSVIQQNSKGKSYKQIAIDTGGFFDDKARMPDLTNTVKKVLLMKRSVQGGVVSEDAQPQQASSVSAAVPLPPVAEQAVVTKPVTAPVVKKSVKVKNTPKNTPKNKPIVASPAVDLGGQQAPSDQPTVVDTNDWDF